MSTVSPTDSPTGLWSSTARNSTNSSLQTRISIAPPRPANDGCEWVWFPEGYWAERQAERRSSSKGINLVPEGSTGKLSRWTRKSARNSVDLLQAEQREMSPRTVGWPSGPPKHLSQASQLSPATSLPQSPYLSEQAHVQSLQRPVPQNVTQLGDQDTWKSPSSPRRLNSICVPIIALISPGEKRTPQVPQLKNTWRAFHKPKEVGSVSFESSTS